MKIIKAESSLSLLVALLLFSIIYVSWSSWQSQQNAQSQAIFQRQQALQIAENQIARLLAGMPCQNRVEQNGIRFEIRRCSSREIAIFYPQGNVIISDHTNVSN